jgi:hypothetical protein
MGSGGLVSLALTMFCFHPLSKVSYKHEEAKDEMNHEQGDMQYMAYHILTFRVGSSSS